MLIAAALIGAPLGAPIGSGYAAPPALSGVNVLGWGFASADAIVASWPNLFVASTKSHDVTEVNAGTGALVRVLLGEQYAFCYPDAMAVLGADFYVANLCGSAGGSVTEINISTGTPVRVISGQRYHFGGLTALQASRPDLFVLSGGSIKKQDSGSLTELDASTGALVRVVSGQQYRFDKPDAMVAKGLDLFVADGGALKFGATTEGSVTEVDASPGPTAKRNFPKRLDKLEPWDV